MITFIKEGIELRNYEEVDIDELTC